MVQFHQTYVKKKFLAQIVRESPKDGKAKLKAEKLSQLVRK